MSDQTLIDTPLKVGDAEPIPDDIDARLVIVAGPDTGTSVVIKDPVTVIGRDEDCQVVLDDPRVSGQHAMVYFASGEFRVRDLNSTNGSLLNGSPLTEFAYQDGDDLRVGKTVARLVVDFVPK
jgi:S-DNA-T family DNA segregation ATPase FtsK/SpoIIIE